MMNPRRSKVSVVVPCTEEIFQATFHLVATVVRVTPKLGKRRFVTFECPDGTGKLCECTGKKCLPSMRRFHGKDARNNWSVTHIDSTKPIKFTWSTKAKSTTTPLGVRLEEKEVASMSFSIASSVLEHEKIRDEMAKEEREGKVEDLQSKTNMWKELEFQKELARRRSELLRECEKQMEDSRKKHNRQVKRLKLQMKGLERAMEPVPEEALEEDFKVFGLRK